MKCTLSSNQPSAVIPTRTGGEGVMINLLDGIEQEALRDLFVGLWLKDQFRVTLDCSHVDHLTLPEALTLVRFSSEFSCRGGFVHLRKANTRVRSLLRDLHCAYLLAAGTRAARRCGVLVGREHGHAK